MPSSKSLGVDSLASKWIKLGSEVNVHGIGSLLWGIEMWVDVTSMLCDAGHPEEGSSGLSAQLAWTLSTDGKPDGTIVSWHPLEITQWAVAQYATMRRGQWELPGGGFLLATHPRKRGP